MKRGGPLKRKTPLAQGGGFKARKPMKRAGRRKAPASHSSDQRWRSETYLSFVRGLPCCVCGATTGIAAHHLIGMWQLSGIGLTAPDSFAMPACDPVYGHGRDCHQQIHAHKALRDRQPGFVRDTISRAVRRFDGEIRAELVKAWAFIDEKEAA